MSDPFGLNNLGGAFGGGGLTNTMGGTNDFDDVMELHVKKKLPLTPGQPTANTSGIGGVTSNWLTNTNTNTTNPLQPNTTNWANTTTATVGVPADINNKFKTLAEQNQALMQQVSALNALVRTQKTRPMENHLPQRVSKDDALTLEEHYKVIEQNYIETDKGSGNTETSLTTTTTTPSKSPGVLGQGRGASSLRVAAASVYGGDRRKATNVFRGSPAQLAKQERDRLLRQSPQTKAFTPTKSQDVLPTEIKADPALVKKMIQDAGSFEVGKNFNLDEISVYIAYQPIPHNPHRIRNVVLSVVSGDFEIVSLRLTTKVPGGHVECSGTQLLDMVAGLHVSLVKKERQPNLAFGRGSDDKRVERYLFQKVDPTPACDRLRKSCGLYVEFAVEQHCSWDSEARKWVPKPKQDRYVARLQDAGWTVDTDSQRASRTFRVGEW